MKIRLGACCSDLQKEFENERAYVEIAHEERLPIIVELESRDAKTKRMIWETLDKCPFCEREKMICIEYYKDEG